MTTTNFYQLKRNKEEVLSYFNLSQEDLNKSYQSGKWTVRQLLHHLVDAETVLYERIRRAISKPGQVVWGFDQDAWAEGLNYHEYPLSLNESVFSSVRDSIIYLSEKYYESKGQNKYIHSETGNRLLHEEFDKVLWHADHHLNQIRQALKE